MKTKIGLGAVGITIIFLIMMNIRYHIAESKIDTELEKIRTEKLDLKNHLNEIQPEVMLEDISLNGWGT